MACAAFLGPWLWFGLFLSASCVGCWLFAFRLLASHFVLVCPGVPRAHRRGIEPQSRRLIRPSLNSSGRGVPGFPVLKSQCKNPPRHRSGGRGWDIREGPGGPPPQTYPNRRASDPKGAGFDSRPAPPWLSKDLQDNSRYHPLPQDPAR